MHSHAQSSIHFAYDQGRHPAHRVAVFVQLEEQADVVEAQGPVVKAGFPEVACDGVQLQAVGDHLRGGGREGKGEGSGRNRAIVCEQRAIAQSPIVMERGPASPPPN